MSGFDITECLDDLRRHDTAWVRAERDRELAEIRRREVRVLALTRVPEPVLVDHEGSPVTIGKVRSSLSPKILRAVLARDGHRCRNCGNTHGLQVHHLLPVLVPVLLPVAWGGTDEQWNMAAIWGIGDACHPVLVPHGEWVLEGNPNLPDGLRLVHWTEAQHVEPPAEWIAARRRRGPTCPRTRNRRL